MIDSNLIRRKIVDAVFSSREGHIASSFSIVEILLAISSDMEEKLGAFFPDNFILSKGHATYAYYAFLNSLGMMTDIELESVGKLGSKLYGHLPYIKGDKRFSYGSGSLGHGLPYALGVALANSISLCANETYCLIGDGEANEGTFWETLLLAEKFNNAKLNILVDCNDSSERALPIKEKLTKFASLLNEIEVCSCDGHDVNSVRNVLKLESNIKLILCNTTKGYPSSLMINNPVWHHRIPNESEMKSIVQDIS